MVSLELEVNQKPLFQCFRCCPPEINVLQDGFKNPGNIKFITLKNTKVRKVKNSESMTDDWIFLNL